MQYLLALIFLFPLQLFAYDDCQNLSSDCEFYLCVEKNKLCGKTGYLTDFGYKYCNKFEKNRNHFSHEGQIWVENVKNCLINNIIDLNDSLTCSQLKKETISHHVSCYVDFGYCDLGLKDKLIIRKIIFYSAFNPILIKAGLEILSYCH